jgi:hypothetical protein
MSTPAFTVLLPVNRPPAMLPYAIESVLMQDRRDFELMVICDGAPPETAACARDLAERDSRIQVFAHPKGERHGEVYRDQVLRQARGRFVCQIGDDDLWLPDHLDEMSKLLDQVDFGNLPQVEVMPDGTLEILPGTLADARLRGTMLTERFNFFGPTVAGYRIEAYRALPVGWSPAPRGIPTDLFMWRKFLAHHDLRFGSRIAVTALKFSADARKDWSLEQRRSEVAAWAARLSDPAACDLIAQSALSRLSQSARALAGRNEALETAAHAIKGQFRQAQSELLAREVQLRQALGASEDRSDKLSRKLYKTRGSWSWRLTRPFRKLARRIAGREAR